MSAIARICKKNEPVKTLRALTGTVGHILGGDEGDRTPGLGIANAALSQLSYIPGQTINERPRPPLILYHKSTEKTSLASGGAIA